MASPTCTTLDSRQGADVVSIRTSGYPPRKAMGFSPSNAATVIGLPWGLRR